MPDYIYLLENRLSADQRNAVKQLREAAREAGTILFLTGDAVRDLTSGHAVRNLEISVHGNAIKLKKSIEKLGGKVWGEHEPSQSLYLCFPGTVRVNVISTHSVSYPKPGKPVYHSASIQEDLRRRDFTVNAMAISLNEGSFGLLMDPLNGVADIESRTLRLVSNYGFLEEPALLIRATRYRALLGWELDPKTSLRYDNAKAEGVIESLSAHARSQELEQIGHEEDGLQVLRALEAEGWMKVLFPAWTSAKADEEKLKILHELAVELLVQGVHADMSAAQMELLTAKLAPKDIVSLKKSLLRPGFVEEWDSLDTMAAAFQKALLAKPNATPSAGYKLFTSYDPEAVLWLGFTSKATAVMERYNLFLKVWPESRQLIPHALMQEMRITPELPGYSDLVHAVFLELIDGKLTTPEEMRAYLEPHSPPAPPPQVTIKRPRAKRGAEKVKEQSFDDDEEAEDAEDALVVDEDLDDIVGDEDEIDLGLSGPKVELDIEIGEDADSVAELAEDDLEDEEEEEEPVPVHSKSSSKKPSPTETPNKAAKPGSSLVRPETKAKPASPAKAEAKPQATVAKPDRTQESAKAKSAPAVKKSATTTASAKNPSKAAAKAAAKPSPSASGKNSQKAQPKTSARTPVKLPLKAQAKLPTKSSAKANPQQAAKSTKPKPKKPAPKPAKKR